MIIALILLVWGLVLVGWSSIPEVDAVVYVQGLPGTMVPRDTVFVDRDGVEYVTFKAQVLGTYGVARLKLWRRRL